MTFSLSSSFLWPTAFVGAGLLVAITTLGCQPDTQTNTGIAGERETTAEHGHEHTEMPKTYDAAVGRLADIAEQIDAGFAGDEPDAVDDKLHEVGHLLEATEGLLGKAGLSEAQRSQAQVAINDLFDAYGAADAKMHGNEGSPYADVSAKIDDAIATLKSTVKDSP